MSPIDFNDITVNHAVDTATPGVYPVEYSYGGITSTATITVKADQTAVNVLDSTLYVGDTWDAMSNFGDALDKDGNPVEFSQVEVVGMVDTTTPGTYSIEYRYGGVSKTILITVKAKDSNTTEGGTLGNGTNNDQNLTESTNQSIVEEKPTRDNSVSSQKSTEKTPTNKGEFPKTGEKASIFLSIVGIVLFLTGITFF